MVARMPMIETTIMSSINVKPCALPPLPVLILRSIERGCLALRHDVVHILTTPTRRLWSILVATEKPVRRAGEGVDWHDPQIPPHGRPSRRRFFSCKLHTQKHVHRFGKSVGTGDLFARESILQTHRPQQDVTIAIPFQLE